MYYTIVAIGKEFGMLPSQVLKQATTFDLEAIDIYTTYNKAQKNIQEGKPQDMDMYRDEDLAEMLNKYREGK